MEAIKPRHKDRPKKIIKILGRPEKKTKRPQVFIKGFYSFNAFGYEKSRDNSCTGIIHLL